MFMSRTDPQDPHARGTHGWETPEGGFTHTGVTRPFARPAAPPGYRLVRASGDCLEGSIGAQWRAFLQRSQSPQRIYQSPDFVRYLSGNVEGPSRVEVFTTIRERDGAVVGIVPVRIQARALDFTIGPLRLFSRQVEVINVLGSVPLTAIEEGARQDLLGQLFAFFPTCVAVSMQAVPVASELWQWLGRATQPEAPFRQYHLDGVRECHTMPLPTSFAAYLQKFTAKKRYNLARQIRLLEQELGPVTLTRIERPEQVPALMQALEILEPGWAEPGCAASFAALAANNLLMHYLLQCGGEPVGAVLGSCFDKVWHVHKFMCASRATALSGGTSAMHLALEDVIDRCGFTMVDFGYGTPNQSFKSTQVLEQRAHVMVYPKRGRGRHLLIAHALCNKISLFAVAKVKQLRVRLRRT